MTKASLALWIGSYNFVKTHRSIHMPPAKAGVTTTPWSMSDLPEAAMGTATTEWPTTGKTVSCSSMPLCRQWSGRFDRGD